MQSPHLSGSATGPCLEPLYYRDDATELAEARADRAERLLDQAPSHRSTVTLGTDRDTVPEERPYTAPALHLAWPQQFNQRQGGAGRPPDRTLGGAAQQAVTVQVDRPIRAESVLRQEIERTTSCECRDLKVSVMSRMPLTVGIVPRESQPDRPYLYAYGPRGWEQLALYESGAPRQIPRPPKVVELSRELSGTNNPGTVPAYAPNPGTVPTEKPASPDPDTVPADALVAVSPDAGEEDGALQRGSGS